jgi:acyl-CoA reductase-like NAD-dependent aldehyde dehydrogenase
VVVDETADLDQAARDIVRGASFDNNIVCVLEKEIIAVESIAEGLKSSLLRHGCVEVKDHQARQLEKVIFSETRGPGKPAVVNKDCIGKCADVILRQIGVSVGKEVRLALVEVDREHPLFLTEQMMPVMPLVRVRTADEGIDLAVKAEHGFGHTAVMHSKNIDNLSRMAREINCSIFVKNGPSVAGLGYGGEGHTSFSIASPTGEGLTSARSFTRDRRCVLVDHFRIT